MKTPTPLTDLGLSFFGSSDIWQETNNKTLCNKNMPIICQPVIWHVCWRELSKGSKAGGIMWLESGVFLDVFLMFSHFQSQNFWVLTWETTLFSERQQIFFRPFVSLNAGAILVCTVFAGVSISTLWLRRVSDTPAQVAMGATCHKLASLDMYRLYMYHRFTSGAARGQPPYPDPEGQLIWQLWHSQNFPKSGTRRYIYEYISADLFDSSDLLKVL